MVQQAHSCKACLRHLRRADRVIDGGRLAAAFCVEGQLALAEVHEIGLLPVSRAEIEVAAVVFLQKARRAQIVVRSEEHTSELQSLMRISYAVFRLKQKKKNKNTTSK